MSLQERHQLLGWSRLPHVILQLLGSADDKKELVPPQYPLIFTSKRLRRLPYPLSTWRAKGQTNTLFLSILVASWMRAASAFHLRTNIYINLYKTFKPYYRGQLSALEISVQVSQNFVGCMIDILYGLC